MIKWLRRRRPIDSRIDSELRFHLDQHESDLIARGHSPEEARRLARVALGGRTQVTEELREVHRPAWARDIWLDARLALRRIRHRPGFSAAVMATLALGIGGTTAMFTIAHGVLMRPLPYPEPDRLVTLREETTWSTAYGNVWGYSYPNFVDCEQQARSLTIGAFRFRGGTLSGSGESEFVNGFEFSAGLWRVLGESAAEGRTFQEQDDRPGAQPVLMISNDLWQRRFGGSREAIGATLTFDGAGYTVIGVTRPGFQFGQQVDVYFPLGQNPNVRDRNRRFGLQIWARLAPDATLARAQAELTAIGRALEAQYPDSNRGRTFVAAPLRPSVGNVASTLWLLLGAVGLVLLIACVNIANMLLARAISRRPEFALRVALGAGRWRLARECLVESVVLSVAGGALGVVLAAIAMPTFLGLWPSGLPRASEVYIDWRVLGFAFAASVVSGVLFGLIPAFDAPRRTLNATLGSSGRSVRGESRSWQSAFVALQITLAIVLLACAAVMGRTLLRVSHVDPGVDAKNVLISRVALPAAILEDPAAARQGWDDVLSVLRNQPGVQDAAAVDTVPMRAGNNQLAYSTTAALPPMAERPLALATSVSPRYDAVMGLRILDGRFIDDRDRKGSPLVIVVDDVLARSAFGTDRVVGRQLWVPDHSNAALEIVGVVAHVRHWGLVADDRAAVRAQFYYPFAQLDDRFVRRWSQLMSVAVRTSTPPETMVKPLQQALQTARAEQVMYSPQIVADLAADSLARERFLLVLFTAFAAAALVLACLGVYGVLAFLTRRRTPELAVRLALGGTPRQVIGLVMAQGLRMVAVGLVAGVIAAAIALRTMASAVESVSGIDPAAIALIVCLLATAALLAAYLPARRASRLDAATVLRLD